MKAKRLIEILEKFINISENEEIDVIIEDILNEFEYGFNSVCLNQSINGKTDEVVYNDIIIRINEDE